MGIKPTGVIRLHNNMDSKELDQNITKIKGFKGNGSDMLRARVTNFAGNKATIFKVYKSTFSDRSLIKLEKLKNIILNKNLSTNEMLTKGIKEGQSIKINKFESFITDITDKKEFVEYAESFSHNSSLSADQMFPLEKIDNALENYEKYSSENYRAQTQSSNTKELKENENHNELMELVNELGLEGITLDYLESAAKITTESHKNNQKEVKPTIQDDDLMKMLDDLQSDGKAAELDAILNEFKENSPDDEMDAILNEFKKDSPHNKLDAILNELNINVPDDDLDKNLEELEILKKLPKDTQPEITQPTLNNNSKELVATAKDTELENLKDKFGQQPSKANPDLAKRKADANELRSILKELGLGDNGAIPKLKSSGKNNSNAVNYLKNSPTVIKQKHIDNLKKVIDLDGMKLDKEKPDYRDLSIQKEYVETIINLIASVSIHKKSENALESKYSLDNLKHILKKEFKQLIIDANLGYPPENLIERTTDLDSALKSIDFIPEKKSSWF